MRQGTMRVCLLAVLIAAACGSEKSDDDTGAGAGANAGSGATAGAANGGGSGSGVGAAAGSGASSGANGGSSAGAGAGAGGRAGTGGAGRGGGTAGNSTAGTAGSAQVGVAGEGGEPSAGGTSGFLTPNPLVCRGKDVQSSPDGGDAAFDGKWDFNSIWRAPVESDGSIQDSWVQINVGKGPSKLLFVWHTSSTPDYTITPAINFGAPTAYYIEVSPTGEEGSWTKVAEVTGAPDDTTYRSREHSFDFGGMSYVRMTLTKLVSNQGNPASQIGEIEIHDVSAGSDDTWAIVGLGQSRDTYHGRAGMFPELIHAAHAGYYPALIDLAEAGGKAQDLATSIDDLIALNPDFHHWILAYGEGDAENNRSPEETDFKASMQTVIDKLKAAGKVPLLPTIEKTTDSNHKTIGDFNTVIAALVAQNDLPPAADLWTLFSTKPELLCMTGCESGHEGIDFSDDGVAAVNQLWATTLDPSYAP